MRAKKVATKTCKNGAYCVSLSGPTQPVTNFHKYYRSKDGLKSECKECRLNYQRGYDWVNADLRAAKRKVYDSFFFSDERAAAFNYIAKKIGVNAKIDLGAGNNDSITRYARNVVKKNFKTEPELRSVFNLLSYQLGETVRVPVDVY